MASNTGSESGHLDASGDREVIYCHQCENEWWRDESGLICPRCEGEATEIVTAENDPRGMDDSPLGWEHDQQHHDNRLDDGDSDPDEADIEEHVLNGPGGFFGRRTIYRAPGAPGEGTDRAAPDNGEDIIRRFQEMLGDMRGGRGGQVVGSSGPHTLYGDGNGGGQQQFRVTRFAAGPGIGGNMTRVTIRGISGPTVIHGGNGFGHDDPFQSAFAGLLGQIGPPPNARNNPDVLGGPGGQAGNGPLDLPTALQHLFSQVLNPNAVHGDAVYTQEALDRIITNLMEQNPQSQAPPPASEETIAKLPRKQLDEQMLGPELKGECTICIDEMKMGDEAVVLPCKHWFHDECVVLWLKEHNTCPICRAPIEGESASQSGATQSASQPESSPALSSRPAETSASERRRMNLRQRGSERLQAIRGDSGFDRRNPARRDSNSPPQASSQPARVRSPSPLGRRSNQSERSRDPGNSGGGALSWIRDQFSRDRRRS
ncbi:hypothetical protein BJ170DRAFT_234525 [Xylariales sp. AK1849]|nr:hypothetical protein BJ170DRAFT_234525 [Xylariales sp. AK1849]